MVNSTVYLELHFFFFPRQCVQMQCMIFFFFPAVTKHHSILAFFFFFSVLGFTKDW